MIKTAGFICKLKKTELQSILSFKKHLSVIFPQIKYKIKFGNIVVRIIIKAQKNLFICHVFKQGIMVESVILNAYLIKVYKVNGFQQRR